MTIPFLDLRLSSQSNTDAGAVAIPTIAAPLVFGDIGIQTAGVVPENVGQVRIQLWGYAKIVVAPLFGTVTIEVIRNDEAVPIFTTTYGAADSLDNQAFGFTAIDFPSIALVSAGQIRYRARVYTAAANPGTTIGARNFSGMAAAGNF